MNEGLAYGDTWPSESMAFATTDASKSFLSDDKVLSTPYGTPPWNSSEISRSDPGLSTFQAHDRTAPLRLRVDSEEEGLRVRRVVRKCQSLLELEPDWDSYGAMRPRSDLIETGLLLAYRVIRAGAPEPHVAPTNRGGVQFEWCVSDRELEIEVVGPDRFDVLYEDEAGNFFEGEVAGDIGPILAQVSKLVAS